MLLFLITTKVGDSKKQGTLMPLHSHMYTYKRLMKP